MSKTRKILLSVLGACLICCLGVFTLITYAGCGQKNKSELDSISVTHLPAKTVYVAGSTFDSTGLEVTASYTDGSNKVLESTEYDLKVPSIKVPSSRFETSKDVTVSYTEGEVTKRTEFPITITNKATSVSVTTQPNKTQYYCGEKFECLGLKINATFEDGSTEAVVIDEDNATFSVDKITAELNKVTVTYGGFAFDVDITVKNGLFMEAESGLLNGEEVPKVATGADGGHYGMLLLSDVQAGVKNMYGTHIQTVYGESLKEIKKAELIADENVQDVDGALNAYLNSEEYKNLLSDYSSTKEYKNAISAYENGTNEDIEEWNYSTAVARYKANNSAFLGDLNRGDEVTYLFETDKAGSGKTLFRMSSTWLLGDNGYWTPNEIGEVQLNRVFEFYVNGEKVEISDDVKLEGSKAQDGSYNSLLWTNWNEVEFDISFVAGRNVIVLKALNHDYNSPVQNDNKAVPNIDSLVIVPDEEDVTVSVYDNKKNFSYDITSVELVNEEGVQVKVSGSFSVAQGYVADLIVIKLGTERIEDITIENGEFVAVIDVSEFDANADGYALTVDTTPVTPSDNITIDTEAVTYAFNTYSLSAQNVVKLVIEQSVNYSVNVSEVAIDPTVKLEEVDSKPYIVIGGGSYTYSLTGLNEADATADQKSEINRQIANYIKEYYLFEAELNPDKSANGTGNWGDKHITDATETVNLLEDNKFEIVCELSSLKVGGAYGVHLIAGEASDKNLNSTNYPNFTALDTKTVIIGVTKYEAFYDGADNSRFDWDCLAIVVSDARKFSYDNVSLAEEEDEVYVVINGSYEYLTKEYIEAELAKINADYTYHANFNTSALREVEFTPDDITTTVTEGTDGGTYTITLKLTDKTAGTAFFHLDFSNGTTNFRCELADDNTTVTVDDVKFTLYITSNTHTGNNWAEGLVGLKIENVGEPVVPEKSYGTAELTGIVNEGDKVYLVATGDCTGYTADELTALLSDSTIRNTSDWQPVNIDTSKLQISVSEDKYTVKYDITNLAIVNNGECGYFVFIKPFGAGESGDIKSETAVDAVIYNGISYSHEVHTQSGWEDPAMVLIIKDVKKFNGPEKAEFVTDDNKIYYAVTFSTENVTLEQIKAKYTRIDLQPVSGNRVVYENDDLIFGELGADGKITVKVDITDLGEGVYVPHYFEDGKTADNDGQNILTDDNVVNAVAATTFGAKTYEVKQTTVSGWGNWTAYLLNVSSAS